MKSASTHFFNTIDLPWLDFLPPATHMHRDQSGCTNAALGTIKLHKFAAPQVLAFLGCPYFWVFVVKRLLMRIWDCLKTAESRQNPPWQTWPIGRLVPSTNPSERESLTVTTFGFIAVLLALTGRNPTQNCNKPKSCDR